MTLIANILPQSELRYLPLLRADCLLVVKSPRESDLFDFCSIFLTCCIAICSSKSLILSRISVSESISPATLGVERLKALLRGRPRLMAEAVLITGSTIFSESDISTT